MYILSPCLKFLNGTKLNIDRIISVSLQILFLMSKYMKNWGEGGKLQVSKKMTIKTQTEWSPRDALKATKRIIGGEEEHGKYISNM
jgi:hypothetical protein